MMFPESIYLFSLVAGGLAAAGSAPLWRRWCLAKGVVDDPGHRKIHQEPAPLAGGLAVLTGLILPLLLGIATLLLASQLLPNPELIKYGYAKRAPQLLVILAGALGIWLLGFLDDKHELRPSLKFAGQLLVAVTVAASGIRVTLFVPIPMVSYLITVLWILTLINAFNFIDNMNGLCGGLGAIAAWFFALAAALQGQYLVASFAFLTCGALIGFLFFNFPNGRMFLGDSGSHLTGYLLAVLAILPNFYSSITPNAWAVLSPLLVLSVPILDLISVVIIRWRAGRPFYIGDNNHFSHRLHRAGLSRVSTVLLLWLAGAFAGLLSLLV